MPFLLYSKLFTQKHDNYLLLWLHLAEQTYPKCRLVCQPKSTKILPFHQEMAHSNQYRVAADRLWANKKRRTAIIHYLSLVRNCADIGPQNHKHIEINNKHSLQLFRDVLMALNQADQIKMTSRSATFCLSFVRMVHEMSVFGELFICCFFFIMFQRN